METPTIDPNAPYAIYARTSSDDKETGVSGKIDEHVTQAEECAKRYGLKNCKGIYAEANISGGIWPDVADAKLDTASETKYKGKRRPKFTTIIHLIEAKAIKYLVVSSTTRICRPNNLKQLIYLMELFKQYNVIILSDKNGIIDYKDFFQTLIELMKGGLGREEINNNNKNAIAKRKKLAESGYVSSAVDFGYSTNQGKKSITLPDGKESKTSIIIIDPKTEQIIKDIYNKYNIGETFYGLRKWLEESKIETKRGKYLWRVVTLKKILSNPHYVGKYRAADGTIKDSPIYPKIIDFELWLQVQSKLANARKYAKKSHIQQIETPYPLAGGLMRCLCGASMQGQKINNHKKHKGQKSDGNDELYYRCTSLACKNKAYVKANEMHKLAEIVIENKDNCLMFENVVDNKNKEYYAEIDKLKTEINKLNAVIEEYKGMEFESERRRIELINAKDKEINAIQIKIEKLQTYIIGQFPVNGNLQDKARHLINTIKITNREMIEIEMKHNRIWKVKAKKNIKKNGWNYVPDENEMSNIENGLLIDIEGKDIKEMIKDIDKHLNTFEE